MLALRISQLHPKNDVTTMQLFATSPQCPRSAAMSHKTAEVTLCVNEREHFLSLDGQETLAAVLREKLKLTGTKIGCNAGECGACTIILDDRAVCSCLVPALRANGGRIRTIEGESSSGAPSRIQQAMLDHGAFQCGFCTPGVVMSLTALFESNPRPIERDIRIALQGNICRCTGYVKILEAALSLAGGAGA